MFKRVRINQQITASEIRVTDETGKQIGVMSLREALELAEKHGLDLIEVAPEAKPPVVRMMDYGKFQYLAQKEEKKAKAGQKREEMKTIRLTLQIGQHDMIFKAQQAAEFLKEGMKVQIEMVLRGREKYQKSFHDLGRQKIENFVKIIPIPTKTVQELKRQPRSYTLILTKA